MNSSIIKQLAAPLIEEFEGRYLQAYLCPANVWTIGVGSTRNVKEGMTITDLEATARLNDDMMMALECVRHAVKVPLNDYQAAALVSFVFNVGSGKKGVKDGFEFLKSGRPSTMLAMLNKGDYQGAAAQFPRWNKANGKVLNGLVRRRAAEMALFLREDKQAMPQAVDAPKNPVTGRTAAGIGIVAISETAQQITKHLEPAIGHSEIIKAVFVASTLIGVAMIAYARWDDYRKGVR